MFGEAFEEPETYGGNRPSAANLERLLNSACVIALAALKNAEVVGGIAAYELQRFEQARSAFYIYDLAVAAAHRRKGIATGLFRELKNVAAVRGAHVVFVQADPGDAPAIALYPKLGERDRALLAECGRSTPGASLSRCKGIRVPSHTGTGDFMGPHPGGEFSTSEKGQLSLPMRRDTRPPGGFPWTASRPVCSDLSKRVFGSRPPCRPS
jgi:aminoglycoside 3-N-acetyltransferase I